MVLIGVLPCLHLSLFYALKHYYCLYQVVFMIDERNAFKRESKCGDSQFKSSFKSNRKLGLTAF